MKAVLLRANVAGISAALALCAAAQGSIVKVDLSVPDLVLKDGTHYRNLVIKTYDPAIGRVMALDDKTYITLADSTLPPEFLKKLQAQVPPSAFKPEQPTTVVPVPYHPKPEVADTPAKAGQVDPGEAQLQKDLKEAKTVAASRVSNYFRYERSMGSGQVTVNSLKLEWNEGEPVQGWGRRYRFTGRAYLDYFDSVGNSFSRDTQGFEVVVQADAHGILKAETVSTLTN